MYIYLGLWHFPGWLISAWFLKVALLLDVLYALKSTSSIIVIWIHWCSFYLYFYDLSISTLFSLSLCSYIQYIYFLRRIDLFFTWIYHHSILIKISKPFTFNIITNTVKFKSILFDSYFSLCSLYTLFLLLSFILDMHNNFIIPFFLLYYLVNYTFFITLLVLTD